MLVERHLNAMTRDPKKHWPTCLEKLLFKRIIIVPFRDPGHGIHFGRLFVFIYVTS